MQLQLDQEHKSLKPDLLTLTAGRYFPFLQTLNSGHRSNHSKSQSMFSFLNILDRVVKKLCYDYGAGSKTNPYQ